MVKKMKSRYRNNPSIVNTEREKVVCAKDVPTMGLARGLKR